MPPATSLIAEVRCCTVCAEYLPLGPRPILQLDPRARILVAGQAPGRKAHQSGIPFSDPSGDRLREWLGLASEVFYDPTQVAILPMAFCFPGTGQSGDRPPSPVCAPTWREPLLQTLTHLELTLVIGRYAQAYHLPGAATTVTKTVEDWRRFWPTVVPLPHPSPRNNRWLRQNPWFEEQLLPQLRDLVAEIIGRPAAR